MDNSLRWKTSKFRTPSFDCTGHCAHRVNHINTAFPESRQAGSQSSVNSMLQLGTKQYTRAACDHTPSPRGCAWPTLILLFINSKAKILLELCNWNILKHTEPNHPDYYLLPLCTRHFQTFISRFSHLLRYNEELLKQNRKGLKRCVIPLVQQNKMKGLEQIQYLKSDEWELTPRSYQRLDNLEYSPHYTSDLELEPKLPPVKSFSESEHQVFCKQTRDDFNLNEARSIISHADPLCPSENNIKKLSPGSQDFLYRSLEGWIGDQGQKTPVHPEDEESIQNASLLDQCSVRSSDSSLDVHFMKALNYIPAWESETIDYSLQLTACYPVSQDDPDNMYPHHCCETGHDVFNETQSENYSSADYRSSPSENLKVPVSLILSNTGSPALKTKVGDSSQMKLFGTKSSQWAISSSPRSKDDSNQTSAVWMESEKDNSAIAIKLEEAHTLCKKEESKQTALGEQNRKQDPKGGFRNSFRKLFRKKSNQNSCSLENKQKFDGNPTQDAAMIENQEFKERVAHFSNIDRGTAV
ncbi:rho guanine nucleotide exchange factor 33-like [Heterodontus francisci]|uniref:rho guanine nucleotide exchange factor 33-like n=1 Tax=Heterodontus francisci TaxID=7792 RepID=UPI00355B0637